MNYEGIKDKIKDKSKKAIDTTKRIAAMSVIPAVVIFGVTTMINHKAEQRAEIELKLEKIKPYNEFVSNKKMYNINSKLLNIFDQTMGIEKPIMKILFNEKANARIDFENNQIIISQAPDGNYGTVSFANEDTQEAYEDDPEEFLKTFRKRIKEVDNTMSNMAAFGAGYAAVNGDIDGLAGFGALSAATHNSNRPDRVYIKTPTPEKQIVESKSSTKKM